MPCVSHYLHSTKGRLLWSRPSVRPSVTEYQRLNRLSNFRDIPCGCSEQNVVEEGWASWKLAQWQSQFAGVSTRTFHIPLQICVKLDRTAFHILLLGICECHDNRHSQGRKCECVNQITFTFTCVPWNSMIFWQKRTPWSNYVYCVTRCCDCNLDSVTE